MSLSEIHSQLTEIEELLSTENQIWSKMVEKGIFPRGAVSDVHRLKKLHEKLGQDLGEEIKENQIVDAVDTLVEVMELHEEIQYQKIYDNENIPDSIKQRVKKYEKRLDSVSKDLIRQLQERSKRFNQEVEKRPTIIFEESVISKLGKRAFDTQVNQKREYPAILYYRRTRSGLRITGFDSLPNKYIDDENSSETGIAVKDEFKDYAADHINDKWILFHTHPYKLRDASASFNLSEGDKSSRKKHGLGILVVGSTLKRLDDVESTDMVFWATTAVKRPGRESIHTEYLPIKVKNGEDDVTANYELIQKYNKRIQDAVGNSEDPYNLIFHGN